MIIFKKHVLPVLLSFLILFSVGALIVHAQNTGVQGSGGSTGVQGSGVDSGGQGINIPLQNPFKTTGDGTLLPFLKSLLNNVVIPVGAVLCVLAFIYAGFLYVTAGGDGKKAGSARNMLLNAAIGTALVLGATAISDVVQATIQQLQR